MKFKLQEVDENDNVIGVTEINMNVTKQELEDYQNLFCECNYLKENSKIKAECVTNYKGVSHGWICPKCRKFVQIG